MRRREAEECVVVEITNKSAAGRFFAGFGKAWRVQSAWSIAGAKRFGTWDPTAILNAQNVLMAKGYTSKTRLLKLTSEQADLGT
jgi:hypothetical protein